ELVAGLGGVLETGVRPDLLVVEDDAVGEVPGRRVLLALVDGRLVERLGPLAADLGLEVTEVGEATGLGVGRGLRVADLEDVRRVLLGQGGGQLLLDAVPLLDLELDLRLGLLLELGGEVLLPLVRRRAVHHPHRERLAGVAVRARLLVPVTVVPAARGHGEQHARDSDRGYQLALHAPPLLRNALHTHALGGDPHNGATARRAGTRLPLNGLDQQGELGLDLWPCQGSDGRQSITARQRQSGHRTPPKRGRVESWTRPTRRGAVITGPP